MRYVLAAMIGAGFLAACSGETPELAPVEEVAEEQQSTPDTIAAVDPAEENVFDPKTVFPHWYAPTAPFRVMGNLHYVGSEGLAVWFIPTDEGHIVIDGGVPETAAHVMAGIRALGYDPADIAILLNTHAHFDHSGGLAELKAISGAQMMASEGDRSALEGGFYLGSEEESVLNAPPVSVDHILADGETVSHGGVTLRANLTPGHSRGCTSWTFTLEEGGAAYEALIFCSVSVAANRLIDPPQYEGIVEDYKTTFARIADWTPDVFLANHSEFFDMKTKRAALEAGDPLAFVERTRFPAFAKRMQGAFEKALAEQTGETAD